MIAACYSLSSDKQDTRALLEILHQQLWHEPLGNLSYLPSGKPVLPQTDRYLSLSHAQGCVCAVMADTPCGCDCEPLRPHSQKVIECVTSAAERDQFEFLELWTLKESYFKLAGDAPDGDVYGFMAQSQFRRGVAGIQAPRSEVSCGLYRADQFVFALACERQPLPATLAYEELGSGIEGVPAARVQ